MRILVATALAAVVAAGCGSAPNQRHQPVTASVPSTLTKVKACQLLRDDLRRNQGGVDMATLRAIADHVTAPRMAADTRTAIRDIGHTGTAPVALSLLRDDCARAGVHMPGP